MVAEVVNRKKPLVGVYRREGDDGYAKRQDNKGYPTFYPECATKENDAEEGGCENLHSTQDAS